MDVYDNHRMVDCYIVHIDNKKLAFSYFYFYGYHCKN